LKDLRNRINKKINKNYNQRQKIISEVKQALDIDFNKISIYSSEIMIFPASNKVDDIHDNKYSKLKIKSKVETVSASSIKKSPLFKVELPDSIVGSQRYYYNGIELSNLSIDELNNLKKDLDYILEEIEKEVDKLLI
jgi:hypothetical protein